MKEHDEISKITKFGSKMPKITRNIASQTFAMFSLDAVIIFSLNRLKISFKRQIVH